MYSFSRREFIFVLQELKWWINVNSKVIRIILLLLLIGIFPNPFQNVHGNTNMAIEWCADNNYEIGCSGALDQCINAYIEFHNLSEDEFSTYVWSNNGFQYDKVFPYDSYNLFKVILITFIIGIKYKKEDKL